MNANRKGSLALTEILLSVFLKGSSLRSAPHPRFVVEQISSKEIPKINKFGKQEMISLPQRLTDHISKSRLYEASLQETLFSPKDLFPKSI